MAKWLAGKALRPTVALVSTARRTQETWALVAPELGKVTKRDVAEIYEAPAERMLRGGRGCDGDAINCWDGDAPRTDVKGLRHPTCVRRSRRATVSGTARSRARQRGEPRWS